MTQDFSFRDLIHNIAQFVKWGVMLVLLIVSFVFKALGEIAHLFFGALTFIMPMVYKPAIWLACVAAGVGGLASGTYIIYQEFGGSIVALLPAFVFAILPVTVLLEVGFSWGGLAAVGLAMFGIASLMAILPPWGKPLVVLVTFFCCVFYEKVRVETK